MTGELSIFSDGDDDLWACMGVLEGAGDRLEEEMTALKLWPHHRDDSLLSLLV